MRASEPRGSGAEYSAAGFGANPPLSPGRQTSPRERAEAWADDDWLLAERGWGPCWSGQESAGAGLGVPGSGCKSQPWRAGIVRKSDCEMLTQIKGSNQVD